MAISGIGENGQVDWSAILGQVLSSKSAEGMEGNSSIILDGDNVTISMVDPTSGESISRTLALPELRPDSLAADAVTFLLDFAAQIDEIVDQLKVLAEEVGEEEPAPTPADGGDTAQETVYTNSQKTLFSIYELINLMQEIAQKERDSAREIRLAELQSQTASIMNQAEHQRLAAVYGLVLGTVTAAVQVGMLVGTSAASVKGLQKMDSTAVGQDLQQAKTDVKTLDAALKSPEAATANYNSLAAKSPDGTVASVEARLNSQEITTAKAEYETAKADLANPPDGATQKQLDELNTAVTEKQAAYKQALENAVAQKDAQYAEASAATKAAEGKYVDEYSLKRPANNRSNYKAMGNAQDRQKAVGAERSLLKAKVAELESGMTGERAGLESKRTTALQREDDARHVMKVDKGYRLAAANPAASGAYQQLAQMIGTIGQGIGQLVEANESAKATEEQAKQKEEEQYRDETNQLFQQAQELINSVRSLLQAVIQAESQSVEQIIRA